LSGPSSSKRTGGQPSLPAMSANGDVTVVIPCFGYGEFLGEAVESALAQEGGAPHVVVVDDGSTDERTLRAFEELPDGVRLLRRENAGVAAARNAGAAVAQTDYLLMLDADDRLRPGALATLRVPLAEEPSLGFAYGAWSGRLAFPDFDPYRLLYRSIVTATSLIRRELFEAVGGFDASLPGYEDWDLYLGVLEAGRRGRRVPEVVLDYRRHASSRLSGDRRDYRRRYRAIRAKHPALYARAGELARESPLTPAGRLVYRTWWAWRPLPGRVEQTLYRLLFRLAARLRASSTSSAKRRASAG
jgi:glycosyltransferase involved in cell wall biosynthesis